MINPSDLTLIRKWLKDLNDQTFVAMDPPTRERFTQEDGHYDAREEIAERGLKADTAYIVWHHQAHRFNRSGALTGALPIYFGGDRSVVASKLATVPDLFVVSGGDNDEDAFRLQRRLNLDALDLNDHHEVGRIIDSLSDGMSYRLGGLPALSEPLAHETVQWVRAVLADPAGRRENRVGALVVLEGAKAVSEADLAIVLGQPESLFLVDGEWDFDVLSAIRQAWAAARIDAEPLVRTVVACGGERAESALLAWPDLTAIDEARAYNFAVTGARVRAAVEQKDARLVAIEDAVAAHQSGDTAATKALAGALPMISPAPGDAHDGSLLFDFSMVLNVLCDPLVPLWLRGLVADTYDRTYCSLKADSDRGALPAYYTEEHKESTRNVLAQWPGTVATVRKELGDADWHGPNLEDKWNCQDTLGGVRALDEHQERWFHQNVQQAGERGQPLSLDGWGYLLEPLVANKLFTSADADSVLKVWRKQLVGKADDYQYTQHPLLSLALGLLQLEHDQAPTVIGTINKLKPKWALPLQHVLAGHAEPDRREELWQAAAATHLMQQHGAMVGYVLLDSRIRNVSPVRGSLDALQRGMELKGPPGYSVRSKARWLALEFASGHPRLLNRTEPHTQDHHQAGAKIEADPELPQSLRVIWAETAK